MAISTFELFSIGIGPSSSHTVGPMRAAAKFLTHLDSKKLLEKTEIIEVQFFGSLGATGKGHGSDKAVIAGLEGYLPESADPDLMIARLESIKKTPVLNLSGKKEITFDYKKHLSFSGKVIGVHPNAMKVTAKNKENELLLEKTYYSVGGGFVVDESATDETKIVEDTTVLPFEFKSGEKLLELCAENNFSISELMLQNEQVWRSEKEIRSGLFGIWKAMSDCIEQGCKNKGILPGGLKVKRRAAPMFEKLKSRPKDTQAGLSSMDWVTLWALAVNEENAAGGRVVTAPTNGAAGIIPAVLKYYHRFCPSFSPEASDDATVRFLLTAAAIGTLFKENASISGAEVGCQGEVGSACSMAAGALCEVMGGTPSQVENAAEIGMEHNLGLTCDPIKGLVQVPCIERNAIASVKAIAAARLALYGDGEHFVSLDKVIKTMQDTGRDMKTKYKETARGGLAVNVIEC